AGAFNKTISEIVKEVECFDLEKKQFVIKKNFDCGFSYRQSIFKKEKKYIIWQAKLNFIKTNKEEIESNMSNNINYRLERHPKEFSAGSVFKNLLADEILQKNKDLYLELEKQGLIRGEKIGVAYLIEKAGLKGKSIGGAQVSNKHANFIVNNNSATANDIKELIAFVKKEFFNKYNLVLEEELQYLGF
ncbi:MAG: hypothetical protein MUF50_04425, partial [Planctomycetes bacterium]|nr:hypothetical protein [Planctomycetota bacterium]